MFAFCVLIYLIYSFWHLSVEMNIKKWNATSQKITYLCTKMFSSSAIQSTSCFLFFWAFGRRAPGFSYRGIWWWGPIDAHMYASGQMLSQPPLQPTNSTNPFNSSTIYSQTHTAAYLLPNYSSKPVLTASCSGVSVLQASETSWHRLFNVTSVYQPVGALISYCIRSDSPPLTFQSCLVSSSKTKHTFRHSFYHQRSIFSSSTSCHGKNVLGCFMEK